MQELASWGRYPHADHVIHPVYWRSEPLPSCEHTMLPFGLGRSYGDVCLNDGGCLLPTTAMDRIMSFDTEAHTITCEAGVCLSDLLSLILTRGYFLPVSPGTRFVTLGGAIANDVHGKNHHKAGTIGRYIRRFELLRSDNSRTMCSPHENAELFAATIGGLGLTGLITWADLELIPVTSSSMKVRSLKIADLDQFFRYSKEFEADYDYTVAWVDCLATGSSLGRGLFFCGSHNPGNGDSDLTKFKIGSPSLSVPFDFPEFVLNGWSVRLFNMAYYHRQLRHDREYIQSLESFFYPLDAVHRWNRIYGKAGLLQFQCVVPADDVSAIRDILETVSRSRQGSFLAVLKILGEVPSPGMLSFPRPGVTLSLDFPVRGRRTFDLLTRLTEIVRRSGGRLYPAKDACMSAADFRAFYPDWKRFAQYTDPRFSSSFWRRVGGASSGD